MIASLISVYKDPQHTCKMEIDDAPQGDIYNERRRRRNLDFKHWEGVRQELAERLADQMRLNDDAGNLRWANREIRDKLNLLRGRRLYVGYWKNIGHAIDTHATLGQGTGDKGAPGSLEITNFK